MVVETAKSNRAVETGEYVMSKGNIDALIQSIESKFSTSIELANARHDELKDSLTSYGYQAGRTERTTANEVEKLTKITAKDLADNQKTLPKDLAKQRSYNTKTNTSISGIDISGDRSNFESSEDSSITKWDDDVSEAAQDAINAISGEISQLSEKNSQKFQNLQTELIALPDQDGLIFPTNLHESLDTGTIT